MENVISFMFGKNSLRYICDGEVIVPADYKDLDEISVAIFSMLNPRVSEDFEYSRPLLRKLVADLVCRFVDLSDSSSVSRFRKSSKQLDFACDSLSLFFYNSSAVIIEHSVIHIGEDVGTLSMLSNLKKILSSVALNLGFKEDVVVWWYLDDVEWDFIVQNRNVFTDKVDFLESCKAIIIL